MPPRICSERSATRAIASEQITLLIELSFEAEDSPYIARELVDAIDEHDLQSLENHHFYLRLMVNGEPTRPFSAVTEPLLP